MTVLYGHYRMGEGKGMIKAAGATLPKNSSPEALPAKKARGGDAERRSAIMDCAEDIFLACVARHCEELHEAMSSLLVEGSDLRETLAKMGRRYVEFVSSDATVAKFRMIVAEADRVPEMARTFYETGPARGVARLSTY